MSKKFRLSTALDVDDLLLECIPYAIRLANEKYNFNPPITIHEVDKWGHLGTRADVIFEFFDDPEFFKNQPVITGAREFVKKLSKMTEVFISTSIVPKFMGIRAEKLLHEFPEIPADHIYMGSRKDKLNVDILFDDGMHNVFQSNAAYPILMRRPWNQNASGMLAVNNYDEFLKLVEVITRSYSYQETSLIEPGIVILVGPSGSGKGAIGKKLLASTNSFIKLKSYTTIPSNIDNDERYNYVSKNDFFRMQDNNELFEYTMYGGYGFGSKLEDVSNILAKGKNVFAIMDICGAMALKTNFPHVITVYIKREKKELITNILNKNLSNEDKANRIISIDDERNNEDICDYTIEYKDVDTSTNELISILNIK